MLIDELKKLELRLDWATLKLAWDYRLLLLPEIRQMAEAELRGSPDPQKTYWIELLAQAKSDPDVNEALEELTVGANFDDAQMKILCAMLDERLHSLSNDPVDGLVELADFWSEHEVPENHPHRFEDIRENVARGDYYTEANLEQKIRDENAWLQHEVEELKHHH
jgi:hypothetical protein